MATIFATFDSTPATLIADLKAKILLSSDWSNPAGNRVVATTTRGADMVLTLDGAAVSAQRLTLTVHRTAALADPVPRYLSWRLSGGTTSDAIHVRVSAGKDHLYIDIEGPRVGELNPESTTLGSIRCPFFIGDVVPYFASDTTPAVVLVAATVAGVYMDEAVHVSRNQTDTASWVPAHLTTLNAPSMALGTNAGSIPAGVQRLAAADSKSYVFPYVIFEYGDGLRGRIGKAFFAGWTASSSNTLNNFFPALFSKVSYGGDTYMLLATDRYSSNVNTAFGRHDTGVAPVVAIPWAA